MDYDNQVNVVKIADPLGRQVETYQLDNADRVVGVMNIESQQMSVVYGAQDYVNSITRFDGSEVGFGYSPQGWLSEVRYDSSTNNYQYYANGLLQSAGNEAGSISNEYDGANRLIRSVGIGPTGTVSYTYFGGGQVSNVASVAGATVYWYDSAERVASIESPVSSFEFQYSTNNGMVAAFTNNAGLAVKYSYDLVDRLTGIAWLDSASNTVRSFNYSFDSAGMITQKVSVAGGETNIERYAYDSLYRLTGETRLDSTNGVIYDKQYKYDLAGNRTEMTENGATTSYTLGLGNRLASWGTESWMGYAAAGNATSIHYSASNHLDLTWNDRYEVTAISTNGSLAESYGYDALGRRVWTASGSETNYHVYDGIHCVADVDTTGGLVRSYVWGPGIDNLLSLTVHTGATAVTYYALTDHLGTVHALADSSGNIVESYEFDAWGRVLGVYGANREPLTASAVGNRYLWQGREYSWETGLHFFRTRWHDPVTGRWISKDPIGVSGGLNQYVMCGDNPLNFRDPWGLCTRGDDGQHQVDLYARDLMNDRPWIWNMPRWSFGETSEGTPRDLKWDERMWNFRGYVLRGDQMGNVQAAYGFTVVYGRDAAWIVTRGAELYFAIGDFFIGARRGTNWRADMQGSFEMNDLGIAEGIKDYSKYHKPPRPTPTVSADLATWAATSPSSPRRPIPIQ